MALHQALSRLEGLPDEILLQIVRYLEPYYITRLQLVSRKFHKLCLDDEIWKRYCFKQSRWYHFLQNRRSAHKLSTESDDDLQDTTPGLNGVAHPGMTEPSGRHRESLRELQDMANWDPVFPNERVSWYDEYIQRNGPACVNWLQTPKLREGSIESAMEVRGLALYNPYDGNDGIGSMLAVSPLDDGSVCLWDVNGARGRRGGIVAKSRPDILFFDGPGHQNSKRSKRIDTGVTECVSVNSHDHKAFFAVQSHLIEVDLNRLDVVSRESFEWSITTLSAVHEGVPLTVGTSLGIHLHDFRARARARHDVVERLDGHELDDDNPFKSIFDPKPLAPYASLSQPTPISILHLPRSGAEDLISDDIYVAGRFSNILHYDRRKFPTIVGSIHSGARLSTLAALPFPFSTLDHEVRRYGELTAEKVVQSKTLGDGRTLIAGGEYNTKGSLELYGVTSTTASTGSAVLQKSALKNRHNAASSTILSVINHGTRIVFSDGAGHLKWFERDGTTECRRLRIGHSDAHSPSSLFASMPGSDDLARKILSTRSKRQGQDRRNDDDILFWTGEKLGLVSFTSAPRFKAEDFEVQDPELAADEEQRQRYVERMREALERQGDAARFTTGLGLEAVAE